MTELKRMTDAEQRVASAEATIDQILDASREGKRATKLAKWQVLTALIQQHIDEAYMLGEETAMRHLGAMKAGPFELEKARKEAAYWRKWYKEAYRRMTPKQRRG
jgi:hypothetical protein